MKAKIIITLLLVEALLLGSCIIVHGSVDSIDCGYCDHSGCCTACGGEGGFGDGADSEPCLCCRGSGECIFCHGTGYREA